MPERYKILTRDYIRQKGESRRSYTALEDNQNKGYIIMFDGSMECYRTIVKWLEKRDTKIAELKLSNKRLIESILANTGVSLRDTKTKYVSNSKLEDIAKQEQKLLKRNNDHG